MHDSIPSTGHCALPSVSLPYLRPRQVPQLLTTGSSSQSAVLDVVPLSATTLMQVAGVIEVIAGVVVLAGLTRLGGYVVAAWLTLIALSLVSTGQFFDVAVRDLVMALGAFSLARISEIRATYAVPASSRVDSAQAVTA